RREGPLPTHGEQDPRQSRQTRTASHALRTVRRLLPADPGRYARRQATCRFLAETEIPPIVSTIVVAASWRCRLVFFVTKAEVVAEQRLERFFFSLFKVTDARRGDRSENGPNLCYIR